MERDMTKRTKDNPLTAADLAAEEWRWMPGYENLYEVSNMGRVRSYLLRGGQGKLVTNPQLLQAITSTSGYIVFTLSGKQHRVSRLVLTAFKSSPHKDEEACHNNRLIWDNRLENLRWDNHLNNLKDKDRHNTHMKGTAHWNATLQPVDVDVICVLRQRGVSRHRLAKRYGISEAQIYRIDTGQTWSHLTGIEYKPSTRSRSKKETEQLTHLVETIYRLRHEEGWAQQRIAEEVDRSRHYVGQILRGQVLHDIPRPPQYA